MTPDRATHAGDARNLIAAVSGYRRGFLRVWSTRRGESLDSDRDARSVLRVDAIGWRHERCHG